MSKGSSPRPKSVDAETFASNWDKIFNKKTTSVVDKECVWVYTGHNNHLNEDDYQCRVCDATWSMAAFDKPDNSICKRTTQ